jgi:hypothetical protein
MPAHESPYMFEHETHPLQAFIARHVQRQLRIQSFLSETGLTDPIDLLRNARIASLEQELKLAQIRISELEEDSYEYNSHY